MQKELLKKIKALADRGYGGEKENAQAILERLMAKHGISEADLEADKIKTHWFRYREELDKWLLGQIIYMVTGKVPFGCKGRYTNRPRKERGIDCTEAERMEIEANYEFFKAHMQKELELFRAAFANKNRLFPDKTQEDTEEEPFDMEQALKIGAIMEGLDRHILCKSLPEGGGV